MAWGRCSLHFSGEKFDPDAVLRKFRLFPSQVCRRGEPRYHPDNPKVWEQSWLDFEISDAPLVKEQATDALKFLQDHAESLRYLASLATIEKRYLNFAYESRIFGSSIVHCDYLPHELLRLAGELAIDFDLMLYPHNFWASDEEE